MGLPLLFVSEFAGRKGYTLSMNNSKALALITLVSGLVAMSCAVGLSSHHPRKLGQTEDTLVTVSRVHGVPLVKFTSARGVTNPSKAKSTTVSPKTVKQRCFVTELEQGGPGSVLRCETL